MALNEIKIQKDLNEIKSKESGFLELIIIGGKRTKYLIKKGYNRL